MDKETALAIDNLTAICDERDRLRKINAELLRAAKILCDEIYKEMPDDKSEDFDVDGIWNAYHRMMDALREAEAQ